MPVKVFDSEVYRNYYLAMFRDVETGQVDAFEMYAGHPLDANALRRLLQTNRIVTFNGNCYDIPLLVMALTGADNARIKKASDGIIKNNLRGWQFEQQFGVKMPKSIDHIDLIEVAPGKASLKIYGGRLHCQRLQDLPFDPDAEIEGEQRAVLRDYCGNDLLLSMALYKHLLPQLELREHMSAAHEIDLRSKSDAQVAEAVISNSVSKILGRKLKKVEDPETTFRYHRPAFVQFESAVLREVADMIDRLEFYVPDSGKVVMPKELAELKIEIGQSVYRMGIGGLHSSEKSIAHVADESTVLIDRDVVSYYPAIILRTGLAPEQMGDAFTESYRKIVQQRLEAKRAGNKAVAESLKIAVNGSFGKLGNRWSTLYAPHLLIQTTLTGQLALLLLIEILESEGIPVVSANTDGVVIKCPVDKVRLMNFVDGEWEERTGFETEASEYQALYSRDVNNYIALKKGGGVKLKGAYAPVTLQKNPTNEICSTAVVKFLTHGTPIEETINACNDVRKFVTLRQVKGGGVKDGRYLGKAVRWYYSIATPGTIQYKVNGYTVARSEGAEPLMDLPDELPADLDISWYIREANSILTDIGYAKEGST